MEGFDLSDLLGHALNHQITQFSAAFMLAAWIHSGRMKKEIKSQVGAMIIAIESLGNALKADLANHGTRIEKVERKVDDIQKQTKNKEF